MVRCSSFVAVHANDADMLIFCASQIIGFLGDVSNPAQILSFSSVSTNMLPNLFLSSMEPVAQTLFTCLQIAVMSGTFVLGSFHLNVQ